MTTERKLIILLAAILAAFLLLAAWGWLKEHDANIQTEAQTKAADAAKAEKDKAIADRDALLKQYQASIVQQQAAVKTSGDAVKVIDHYVPAAAPAVVVEKQDLAPQVQQELPDAPSYTVQTDAASIATAKQLLQCDADRASLSTCHADLMDTQAKLSISEQSEERWKQTAQGGTKWQRFWRAAKYIGIGAAVGTAAGYAAGR